MANYRIDHDKIGGACDCAAFDNVHVYEMDNTPLN